MNTLDATEQVDHPTRELLPEYATQAALGHDPKAMYPDVVAHLAVCAACRTDLEELLSMTIEMYTGQVAAAPSYPLVDLSFMGPPATTLAERRQPWWIDALGRLVVVFSEQLLESLRQPSLTGALRGQLLYRYVQEPGSVDDLDVTIEAFVEDAASRLGRVRVGVDVPSRGPFDQSGSQVVLRAGGDVWHDQTDELGSVDFAPFPLESLPQLRVEIIPQRNR